MKKTLLKTTTLIILVFSTAFATSCKKSNLEKQEDPTLTTGEVSNITFTGVTASASISNAGTSNVTARGMVWSTTPNPTTADSKTTEGSGTGDFTSEISGLEHNTTYYLRAYATSSAGSAYSNEVSFKTLDRATLFDISNIQEYFIYSKFQDDGSYIYKVLLDFQPDNKFIWQNVSVRSTGPYTLRDDNTTITTENGGGPTLTIDNGKIIGITQSTRTFSDFTFIHKPSTTPSLVGKTFVGSYLRSNGTILHQNFFYRFKANNQVEVGANAGTSTTRTETYTPIGNIGAWVQSVSGTNGHRELLLLINGKLEVSYLEASPFMLHHGSFAEAPQ